MLQLSNRPHFLWVYQRDNRRGMLGEAEKSLAHDLQAFRLFSQHPKWVYHASKPVESVVQCFYKITLKDVSIFYEFTSTINHRFLTSQNAHTI